MPVPCTDIQVAWGARNLLSIEVAGKDREQLSFPANNRFLFWWQVAACHDRCKKHFCKGAPNKILVPPMDICHFVRCPAAKVFYCIFNAPLCLISVGESKFLQNMHFKFRQSLKVKSRAWNLIVRTSQNYHSLGRVLSFGSANTSSNTSSN